MSYEVKIIESKTGEVVKTMPAPNFRQACKIEFGACINLNHAEFHTDVFKDGEIVYEEFKD